MIVINQRKAGAILSYGETLLNLVVGILFTPYLIIMLGKSEFGIYQLIGSVMMLLSVFDFGLSNTVTRYYSRYTVLNDEKSKENLLYIVKNIYLFISVLLFTIGLVLFLQLDNIFSKSMSVKEIDMIEKMYIVILIVVIVQINTSIFNATILAHEHFVILKYLSIIQIILKPLLTITIFIYESNAFNAILVQGFIHILINLIKIYYALFKLNVTIKYHFWDKELLREILPYAFFIFLTVVMDQIFWKSGQVILGIVGDSEEVAVYSIAMQIIIYYMTLAVALSGVFFPIINKRVALNASDEELSGVFIRLGRLQYLLLGLVFSGFILFGDVFLLLWVGKEFEAAYLMILVIMLPFTIDLIQNVGIAILQAKNKYKFRAVIFFIMAILNLILSFPVGSYFGAIGIACQIGLCYFIGNGIVMNYYYKHIGIDIVSFWRNILKLSITMIVPFIVGFGIKEMYISNIYFNFLGQIILYTLIYLLIVYKYGMNAYEQNLMHSFVRKIFKRSSV